MDKARYKKVGTAGSKGSGFQVSLLTMFLLKALRIVGNWRLSSENKRAGKFDDVVLEWPEGAILVQAKHKEKDQITLEGLLSTSSKHDFSLAKYFLSYQEIKKEFKGSNTLIICTNAGVHKTALQFLEKQKICSGSLLYYGDNDYSFYTVDPKILPKLRESIKIYLKVNNQNKVVFGDKELNDFLEHLQIYANYPSEHGLKNIIEQLLSDMKPSNPLYECVSPLKIHAKMMDWFQLKEGIYMTELGAKAMFSELRTDKYWQKLERYRVLFQHNDLQFSDSKRIYHFITQNGYLLRTMKICYALRNDRAKILCVSPDDDIKVQKQVVEAFQLPLYTFLVIVWPKSTQEFVMNDISNTLSATLKMYQYKKIIVVTESIVTLNHLFGLSWSDYDVNLGSETFENLSDETQARLLNIEGIGFRELCSTRDSIGFTKAANLLLPRLVDSTLNTQFPTLDESFNHLYINRTFKRKIHKIRDEDVKEFYSENNIYDVKEKIILISGIAGMGKTTVLSNLAAKIKESHPPLWIIRIQLNDFTATLKNFLKQDRKEINILDLLNFKRATRPTNEFENFVFAMDKKVVLMLDGLDEISPVYTDLIRSVLLQCQQASNFAKVFVTTRPHMVQELEEKLQVASFTLEPFTEENQISFLIKYWAPHLNLEDNSLKRKCVKYAKAFVRKMALTDPYNGIADRFVGVPLQLRMLAEIFQESMMDEDWEGCKEYLHEDRQEPILMEKMNLVKLYEMFIENKRSTFINRENSNGHIAATQALTNNFDGCLSYCQNLALDTVLDERARDLFSCYGTNNDMETVALETGIVWKANGKFDFIHRTFAEYFVAGSIMRELQCQNQNVHFQTFLIDEVFCYRNSVLHTFVDNFVEEIVDSVPSTIFQSYQSVSTDGQLVKHNINLIHKLADEGCVSVLQLLLKCTNFEIIRDKQVDIDDHVCNNIKNPNTLNCLQHLLKQGGLNIYYLGRSPLHLAAAKGHVKMVKFLVEHGANINSRSIWHSTPIIEAVQNGHMNVAKYLFQRTLPLQTSEASEVVGVNTCDMSSLLESNPGNNMENMVVAYVAACMSCLSALEASIERGIGIDSKFGNDKTLIFGAARGKLLHIIEYLVHEGAYINSKDDDGRTALHLISQESWGVSIAQLLIELGIDIDAIDISRKTALHYAVFRGTFYMAKLLVESGANVNIKDNLGGTALSIASSCGRLNCVELLAGNGADVNVKDRQGNTAIHLAARRGQPDVVQFFVERGVDVNSKNNYGQTALHAAAFGNHKDTLQYLVKLGLDVNTTDRKGHTALYIAIEKFISRSEHVIDELCEEEYVLGNSQFHLSGFKCLLDQGADVNVRDENGRAVPHLVAEAGYSDILKLVIEAGADVNTKDKIGRTPLHLAAKEGRTAAVRLLIEHDANVNGRDRNGKTPAALAKNAGHGHLLHYLGTENERPRWIQFLHRIFGSVFFFFSLLK